jgi:hypothetical protein
MENKMVDPSDGRMEVNNSLKAVNTKMKFIETSDRKIAYHSIGKGLPIIMVNRSRVTLDTWYPTSLDALASKFNVITNIGSIF